MPADKLIDSVQLNGALTATANAIRAKTGQEESLTWNMVTGFSVAINQIPTVSEETENDTATAADLLSGKTAHSKGVQIVGTIPTKTDSNLTASGDTVTVPSGYYAVDTQKSVASGSAQTPATTITTNPTITIDEEGKITASYSGSQSVIPTVVAGYVSSGTAGTVSTTGSSELQMDVIPGQIITPSTVSQTLPAEAFTLGTQTILGDANLIASNIKSNVIIFGVEGTFTKSGTQSSGTIATASVLRSGYTAWVNGAEIKGTLPTRTVSLGTTTVSGTSVTRGSATWLSGYIAEGSISPAVFSNTATSGVTYIDISSTSEAPILTAGDYLYINRGYTDNLKISLARLVPNAATVGASLTSDKILSGTTAYNIEGKIVSGSITTIQSSDISINNNVVSVSTGKYTGTTTVTKTIPSAVYSVSVVSNGVSTNPSVTPKAQGTLAGVCTSTAPSGTDGTDYWKLSLSGTTSNGTARAKAKVNVSTGGYIGTGATESNEFTSWSVTPVVNPVSDLYLKKASISGSVTNASCTVTVAPGTVSVARTSVPAGVTDASNGLQTTTPSAGVYVAVTATAAANTTGITGNISGSGTARVVTTGYAPSGLTGSITVSGTATAKTSQKQSSTTYISIKSATTSISGGSVSGIPDFSGANYGYHETNNTSGIEIIATCQMSRSKVTCSASTAGWVSSTINELAAYTYSSSQKRIYLTSVTLPTNKQFTIRTAAGNFVFSDVNGNVTVTGA